MPLITRCLLPCALALALATPMAHAASFVYEGRLDDLGQPANGRYDLKLSAFGDAALGATLAAPITFEGVEVKDGRFRLDVALPLVQADQVWLEVAVRGSGEPSFSVIPGRNKAIAAPLIGACWSSTGDSGVNPAVNFIGTTDAQPFVVRTQNVRSLRIEPSTILFAGNPITTNTIAGSSANNVTAGVRGATIAGGGVPSGASDPDFFSENPNRVTDNYGTVGGGYANRAGDDAGSTIDRAFATVGGGRENTASGDRSTAGGGSSNTASGATSTVGGGSSNTASGDRSTAGGGTSNIASGFASTVGGGQLNTASGNSSTVGGGNQNSAEGSTATIAGGDINKTRADRAFVGGGLRNEVFGSFGSVTGGLDNCAGGRLSWAGGNQAKVRPGAEPAFPTSLSCDGLGTYPGGEGDAGTFVWADSQTADFISTGSNQFLVRAQGGAAINSNNPLGNALRVNGTLRVDTLGTAAATTLCRNANNQISGCSSSARYKQDIDDLALGLDTALRLHAVGYRWKGSLEADVGFVAEEIAEIDERLVTRNGKGEVEGVKYERLTAVLANAVQELAAQGSLAAETVARVSVENAELRADSDALRARLDRLEAALTERAAGER
jgi:hypothetical protein